MRSFLVAGQDSPVPSFEGCDPALLRCPIQPSAGLWDRINMAHVPAPRRGDSTDDRKLKKYLVNLNHLAYLEYLNYVSEMPDTGRT